MDRISSRFEKFVISNIISMHVRIDEAVKEGHLPDAGGLSYG